MLSAALVLSSIQVFIRDTEHVISPVLMLVFYATPILYSLTMVPQQWRVWFGLNPFTYLVARYRDAWLLGAGITLMDLLWLFGAVFLFMLARAWFRRLAPHFEAVA